MGTLVEISVRSSDSSVIDIDGILDGAFNEITRLERIMSPIDPNSQASLLSRSKIESKLKVSKELFDLLSVSQSIQSSSKGAFTISTAIE